MKKEDIKTEKLFDSEILRAKNLNVTFKTKDGDLKVIRDVSISADKGEIVGIVGESGSGKSVLVKSFIGFNDKAKIEASTLNLDNINLLNVKKGKWKKIRGSEIAYIPQDPLTSLNPTMTIGNQLKEAYVISEWKNFKEKLNTLLLLKKKKEITFSIFLKEIFKNYFQYKKNINRINTKKKFEEIFKFIGIEDATRRLKSYPNEFSGGMRQRIAIAIAVISKPKVIIADEPTTALDVTIQAKVLDLLKKLKKELNVTILFISHNIALVANFCDFIYVMYAGKVVEQGLVNEVFTNPKHPYTWALIASLPDEKANSELISIPGSPPNLLDLPKGDPFAERNKYALKIDFEKEPPMFKVTNTHWAATWLLYKDFKNFKIPQEIKNKIEIAKKSFNKTNNKGKNNEKSK
ncbi:MAG: ABC transporter ATP-binding protein [Malacoplasma sp.]|nr:ABC transporter ATP-binding protein [Malacoplasma sp.]